MCVDHDQHGLDFMSRNDRHTRRINLLTEVVHIATLYWNYSEYKMLYYCVDSFWVSKLGVPNLG